MFKAMTVILSAMILTGVLTDTMVKAGNPSDPSAKAEFRIVAFGDSITAPRKGVKVATDQYAEIFHSQKIACKVINVGVPGDNTRGGKNRLEKDVLAHQPDAVVMGFGTNDAAIDVWKNLQCPRVPLKEYLQNMTSMIQEMRRRNITVIVFTPPPMFMTDKLREYYGKEPYLSKGFNFMLDQYVAALIPAAKAAGAQVVDVNALFRKAAGGAGKELMAFLMDGMHPNTRGQQIIVDAVFPKLIAAAVSPNPHSQYHPVVALEVPPTYGEDFESGFGHFRRHDEAYGDILEVIPNAGLNGSHALHIRRTRSKAAGVAILELPELNQNYTYRVSVHYRTAVIANMSLRAAGLALSAFKNGKREFNIDPSRSAASPTKPGEWKVCSFDFMPKAGYHYQLRLMLFYGCPGEIWFDSVTVEPLAK